MSLSNGDIAQDHSYIGHWHLLNSTADRGNIKQQRLPRDSKKELEVLLTQIPLRFLTQCETKTYGAIIICFALQQSKK